MNANEFESFKAGLKDYDEEALERFTEDIREAGRKIGELRRAGHLSREMWEVLHAGLEIYIAPLVAERHRRTEAMYDARDVAEAATGYDLDNGA